MAQRLDYSSIAPEGMKTLADVHSYVGHSGLRYGVVNLVYLRVSQINGCAYCVDQHYHDLLKAGVANEKLILLAQWKEARELFTEQEQAALDWCETVTNVSQTHIPDSAYEAVKKHFSEKQLVDLTLAIGLINAYNRIAISFRAVPKSVQDSQK